MKATQPAGAALRFIYLDEAGISIKEPCSIVAGIILNGDTQWRTAERYLQQAVKKHVPVRYQEGFVFHATEVYSGKEIDRSIWDFSSRVNLIVEVFSIPRRAGFAVVFGYCRRGSLVGEYSGVNLIDLDHVMAYQYCIAEADKYLRSYMIRDEVATAILERVSKIGAVLKTLTMRLKNGGGFFASPTDMIPTLQELEEGYVAQRPEFYIETIVDNLHFVDKDEAPLMQIADACCFALSGFFSQRKLWRTMVEQFYDKFEPADWVGPGGAGISYFHPRFPRSYFRYGS